MVCTLTATCSSLAQQTSKDAGQTMAVAEQQLTVRISVEVVSIVSALLLALVVEEAICKTAG